MTTYTPYPPLLEQLTLQRVDFGSGYEGADVRQPVFTIEAANGVSSERRNAPGRHALLLDVDRPAWLIPSSTEGHAHLYVDLDCSWRDLRRFLRAAARIGLIEPGYARASEQRKHTALRLPWIRKGDDQ